MGNEIDLDPTGGMGGWVKKWFLQGFQWFQKTMFLTGLRLPMLVYVYTYEKYI